MAGAAGTEGASAAFVVRLTLESRDVKSAETAGEKRSGKWRSRDWAARLIADSASFAEEISSPTTRDGDMLDALEPVEVSADGDVAGAAGGAPAELVPSRGGGVAAKAAVGVVWRSSVR